MRDAEERAARASGSGVAGPLRSREAARAEVVLRDGAQLRVEIASAHLSAEEAERRAHRALAVAARELEREVEASCAAGPRAHSGGSAAEPHRTLIGKSASMLALFRLLDRIQKSDATVLVLGENGTGKELIARSIHAESRRAARSFVATNCSAFNDNLLESELFGHRRGAFTGAVGDKPGLFEVADGGTFFMDEVGDMSPALQVKLLRVLQEGVFFPVGGTEPKHVDVRIIAATNRDLSAMVKQGTFREDLFYRLHVVAVRAPPLRERRDDIPLLVQHFLTRLARTYKREKIVTPRALDRLIAAEWRGNVRELENELERLWVMSGDESVIDEDLLSPSVGVRRVTALRISEPESGPAERAVSLPSAVEELERRMIEGELRKARGNKTKAADALGISRRNLIRKVQAYGLEDPGGRPSTAGSIPAPKS